MDPPFDTTFFSVNKTTCFAAVTHCLLLNPSCAVGLALSVSRVWAGSPKNGGSIPNRSKKFISSARRPYKPLDPRSPLFNVTLEIFPGGNAVGS